MPPKIQLSCFKKYSIEQNKSSTLVIKCTIARIEVDYSSSNLPLILVTLTFLAVICLFSSYFFASITLGDGFFQFQDNKVRLKQAPGHNHDNTIFQPGQTQHFFIKSLGYCTNERNIAEMLAA